MRDTKEEQETRKEAEEVEKWKKGGWRRSCRQSSSAALPIPEELCVTFEGARNQVYMCWGGTLQIDYCGLSREGNYPQRKGLSGTLRTYAHNNRTFWARGIFSASVGLRVSQKRTVASHDAVATKLRFGTQCTAFTGWSCLPITVAPALPPNCHMRTCVTRKNRLAC